MSATEIVGGCWLRGSHHDVSRGTDGSRVRGGQSVPSFHALESGEIAGSFQTKHCRVKFVFMIYTIIPKPKLVTFP